MVVRDDDLCGVSLGVRTLHLGVEFVRRIGLQIDVNTAFGDVSLTLLHIRRCGIAQDFQSVVRMSDQGAQCHGNRQSHHAGAGNAHAHGVLQDVCAEPHVDAGGRLP